MESSKQAMEGPSQAKLDFQAVHSKGVVLAAGVSGASRPHDLIHLTQAFQKEGFQDVVIGHDAVIALYGALSGQDGVIVISGTGSIAYGKRRERTARVGGWGYLLGDEGSAFKISLHALQYMMWGYDGRGSRDSVLEEAALEYFQISSVEQLVPVLHRLPLDRGYIGGFTKVLTTLAADGNTICIGILQEAGKELGRLALAAIERLELVEQPGRVGACGGVFAAGSHILQPMQEMIRTAAPAQIVSVPDFEPVVGAVFMGYEHLGLDLRTLRQAFREKGEEWMRQDLSVEEKVGQLMMFGFPGQTITEHIREFILNHHLSGIIHFARNIDNPEQIQTLNHDLQTLAKSSPRGTGLFIAVDQEGGSVARLTEGVSVSPGNMALGAARSLERAEEVGRVTGEELRILGFNINLAPCVDVNNNPANPVIGVRSFGSDPQRVAQLGAASIKGLQEHVIAVAKHFPGHGDTHVDSHLGLPVIDYNWERLNTVELVPFRKAIEAGVEGMLAAHIFFPAFESNPNRPASLSYGVLTKLLREELGFQGLIMTDCMEMQAITKHFSMADAAVLTVEAGSDLVLISHTPSLQSEAYWAVVDAVKSGRISEERIDESVARVQAAKERFQVKTPYPGSVGTEANLKVMEAASEESITVVKDQGNLPLATSKRGLVIETKTQATSLAEDKISGTASLGGALTEEGLVVDRYEVGLECTEEEIKKLVNLSTNYPFVIMVTQDAHRYPSQAQCVRELNKATKVIVVGARTLMNCSLSQRFRPMWPHTAIARLFGKVCPHSYGKRRATGSCPLGWSSQRLGWRLEFRWNLKWYALGFRQKPRRPASQQQYVGTLQLMVANFLYSLTSSLLLAKLAPAFPFS